MLFVIGCAYLCCYCGIKAERKEFKVQNVGEIVGKVVQKEKVRDAIGEAAKKEVVKALEKP